MFGKINEGKLELLEDSFFEHNGKIIANPRETELKAAGYLEVVDVPKPDYTDRQRINVGYTELNGKITPVYEIVEKEVREDEYPKDVEEGYHVERYEEIDSREIHIFYRIVPDVEVSNEE